MTVERAGARRSHADDRRRRARLRWRRPGRHRAAVRPPRQAARDGRLAQRSRAVDPRRRGRPPLRPRRCRRRLRRLRLASPRSRRCRRRRRPLPLPRADRGQRGERLARPARPPRSGSPSGSGRPRLVLCLDSGCLDYERLWITTSLRGLVQLTLDVEILTRGRALRRGERCGSLELPHHAPAARPDRELRHGRAARRRTARPDPRRPDGGGGATPRPSCSVPIAEHFPFIDGAGPAVDDAAEQLLARTWRPALSVVGVDGMPPTGSAGNVLRPHTALKLSLRLPPTCDADVAFDALRARAPGRPALRRAGDARPTSPSATAGTRRPSRAVAVGRARGGLEHRLRLAGAGLRRGRLDPVHGDARGNGSPTPSS